MAALVFKLVLGRDAELISQAPAARANDNPPCEQTLFERCVARELVDDVND